jgi:hypothetical protein
VIQNTYFQAVGIYIGRQFTDNIEASDNYSNNSIQYALSLENLECLALITDYVLLKLVLQLIVKANTGSHK